MGQSKPGKKLLGAKKKLCSSRNNFVGACLAARDGVEEIPMEWIEKVQDIDVILQAAIKVYQ